MGSGQLRLAALVSGVILAVLSTSAMAADEDGRFAVEGGGAQPCSDFIAAAEEKGERYSYYLGWMQGYLTGINRFEDDTYDITPWQDGRLMALALRSFCEKNPQTLLVNAVDYIGLYLRDGRLRKAAPTVRVGKGKRKVALYAPIVARIERRLAELGYFDGTPDETADMDTLAAISAFQQASKLEPTGLPDQTTLYALLSARED